MRIAATLLIASLVASIPATVIARDDPDSLASTYARATSRINIEHRRKPGDSRERDLAAQFPGDARKALDGLLAMDDSEEVFAALEHCGEAAVDLDLVEDHARILERLLKSSPEHAKRVGSLESRERFLVRGIGGLDGEYVRKFADLFDAVLAAYDEVFGFEEYSKVPGKKLRIRVHLETEIKSPPHFAPEFPFHSEIDFPVVDATGFSSPTKDGKFLFYGLCHELGHVVAMWGDGRVEMDLHAWAHYTGVTIVEHLSGREDGPEFLKTCRDVKWRSLAKAREDAVDVPRKRNSRGQVMASLVALHDEVGPRSIGDAINLLDRKDRRRRINHVRYYTFPELREGLLAVVKDSGKRKAVASILD